MLPVFSSIVPVTTFTTTVPVYVPAACVISAFAPKYTSRLPVEAEDSLSNWMGLVLIAKYVLESLPAEVSSREYPQRLAGKLDLAVLAVNVGIVIVLFVVLVRSVLPLDCIDALKPLALFEATLTLIPLRKKESTFPLAQVLGVVTETERLSTTFTSNVVVSACASLVDTKFWVATAVTASTPAEPIMTFDILFSIVLL